MSIEKIFDENADLSKYPPVNKSNPSDTRSRVLGDLHANAGLMLYFWVREGIASIDEEDYLQIQEVYHTSVATVNVIFMPTADASEIIINYQNLLKKVKFNHPVKKIHFVGDTLADRSMSGDQYVLFNYEALDKNNVPFDVCLSNHDLEFITAYWQDKRNFPKVDDRKLESIYHSGINQGGQVNSTNVLSALLNKNVITPQRVNDLVENHYLPHVKLFSYTVTSDSLALITHAPIDFELIQCAAKALGVAYQDETPTALALTIDNINDQFNKRYIQTGDIIELSPSISMDGYASSGITGYKSIDSQSISKLDSDKQLRYVLAALTWNRPYSHEALNRPASHERFGYSLHYVHGHTRTVDDPEHVTNLDSVFGKSKEFYTKEGQQPQKGRYNIGYRTIALPSLPEPVKALQVFPDLVSSSVSVEVQQASLDDVVKICQELVTRYRKKMQSATENNDQTKFDHYFAKINVISNMLTCTQSDDGNNAEPKTKLEKIGELYTKNQQILEAEHDPTSKTLIKALKVILIGVGLVAGLVPGLIAFGVFAKLSHDKTGSMDFLSDEANKTSEVMKLKGFLNASESVGKLGK